MLQFYIPEVLGVEEVGFGWKHFLCKFIIIVMFVFVLKVEDEVDDISKKVFEDFESKKKDNGP